jgi:hypothetical protein
MRKYGAGTREVSRAIFSKTLKQIITHPFPVFGFMNEENIGKCSMISICLVMNSSTISYVRGLSFVNMFGSRGYRLGGLRF